MNITVHRSRPRRVIAKVIGRIAGVSAATWVDIVRCANCVMEQRKPWLAFSTAMVALVLWRIAHVHCESTADDA